MSNLLASRGSFLPASAPEILRQCWWQITLSDPSGHRLQACLLLATAENSSDGFARGPRRARLELEVSCNFSGMATQAELAWHLLDSDDSGAFREIRRFVLDEFDQTFLISRAK